MIRQNKLRTNFYITAVEMSARLHAVLFDAKNISLEAMNAKALVARGGENVRTFKPITDYMVELANDTIELVHAITSEAKLMSKSSLVSMRASEAEMHFAKAKERAIGAPYEDSFRDVHQRAQTDLVNFHKELGVKTRLLNEMLKEIETRMLAANVVTSTSRLEAASVSEQYQTNFASIVQKFDKAAKNIRTTVMECRKILNNRIKIEAT